MLYADFLLYTRYMRRTLIKKALFLILFIFILNKGAQMFYWYTSIFWFDRMMHFLGGVFLAFLGAFLFDSFLKKVNTKTYFFWILCIVCIIGVGWEVFEFSVQEIVKIKELANIPDSFSDLFFDILGGIMGTFFVIHEKNKYTSIHNG